jgi:2-hydroxychromene-2-carboxylate isomerase
MIEIINGAVFVTKWDKHQNVDKLAEMREYNRLAQQKSREKKRLPIPNTHVNDNVNDMSMTCQECQYTDIEKEKEHKNKSINNNARKQFVPPTVDEVRAYCEERHNGVDAERFVDYYTSNGWLVGKNKMKDWKASVRTWERNGVNNSQAQKNTSTNDFMAQLQAMYEEG